MDNKTWLRRRKSSEKLTIKLDKPEDEETLPISEKEIALLQTVEDLNEKLGSLISECNTKDELLRNYLKTSEEAFAEVTSEQESDALTLKVYRKFTAVIEEIFTSGYPVSGQEKAESDALILKQELHEVSQQKESANDRITHLNAALKDYRHQLNNLREEYDQKTHDAVTNTSKQYEKAQKNLERKIESLKAENYMKERLIEEVNRRMSIAESEFNTLISRLDSTEKENAFLKYEFRMLENELQTCTDETGIIRRSADAAHQLHAQSVKKIAKLEGECQRLRVLVKRRKGNLVENLPETPSKRTSFLIDQLCDTEEENKILKEIIRKKDEEIRSLRTTFALSLMDDFVEMEKLAIVSAEVPPKKFMNRHYTVPDSKESCRDLVPVTEEDSRNSIEEVLDIVPLDQETKRGDVIRSLESEMESLRESKRAVEDQLENVMMINEDLDMQLTETRAKMNEILQKFSSLEVEFEARNQLCEELETTCLELQLQLGSVNNNKEPPRAEVDQEETLLNTEWEITAATAKLAECQETIYNLGKQLKKMTNNSKDLTCQRSSLRNRLIEDDSSPSPKTKEIIISSEQPNNNNNTSYTANSAGALTIVRHEKRSGGISFLRKLLLRKKSGRNKNISLPFVV